MMSSSDRSSAPLTSPDPILLQLVKDATAGLADVIAHRVKDAHSALSAMKYERAMQNGTKQRENGPAEFPRHDGGAPNTTHRIS